MTNRAGEDFTREVRRVLVDNGRTVADIVAGKPGEWLLVQCKADGRMYPKERADLIAKAAWLDAVPLLAWWAKDGCHARQVAFARVACVAPPLYVPWTPDYGLDARQGEGWHG